MKLGSTKELLGYILMQDSATLRVQTERVPALKRALSKAKARHNKNCLEELREPRKLHYTEKKDPEAGYVVLTCSLATTKEMEYEIV